MYSNDINTIIDNTKSYMDVMIDTNLWNMRIQDVGCAEKNLPKKRYRAAKILSVGPIGSEKIFHNLTTVAVNIVKSMVAINAARCGWKNLPRNYTNVKAKIVQTILQNRMMHVDTYIFEPT